MTTNVFDKIAGVIATDSRWSVQYINYIIYIDDSGFEKIELCNGHAFMFAGLSNRVHEWKNWLRTAPADPARQPPHAGMAVCMVRVVDRIVVFKAGVQIDDPAGALFAGTGSMSAYGCWATNRSARRSVETAKQYDYFTGGDVKYFEFESGSHNLVFGSDITFTGLQHALNERGLVMEMNKGAPTKAPMKLKDAVASNDVLRDASAKIVSGELHACAPCLMLNEWSEEEKAKFNDALGAAFNWRK